MFCQDVYSETKINEKISGGEEENAKAPSSNAETINLDEAKIEHEKKKGRRSKKDSEIQAEIEYNDMLNQLANSGLTSVEIPGDGNCMFRAVNHQLNKLDGKRRNHLQQRRAAVDYIRQNKDVFKESLEGEDLDRAIKEKLDKLAQPGEYGDEYCLTAMANTNGVNITVHCIDAPNYVVSPDIKTNANINICYYKQREHYDSVVPLAAEEKINLNEATRAKPEKQASTHSKEKTTAKEEAHRETENATHSSQKTKADKEAQHNETFMKDIMDRIEKAFFAKDMQKSKRLFMEAKERKQKELGKLVLEGSEGILKKLASAEASSDIRAVLNANRACLENTRRFFASILGKYHSEDKKSLIHKFLPEDIKAGNSATECKQNNKYVKQSSACSSLAQAVVGDASYGQALKQAVLDELIENEDGVKLALSNMGKEYEEVLRQVLSDRDFPEIGFFAASEILQHPIGIVRLNDGINQADPGEYIMYNSNPDCRGDVVRLVTKNGQVSPLIPNKQKTNNKKGKIISEEPELFKTPLIFPKNSGLEKCDYKSDKVETEPGTNAAELPSLSELSGLTGNDWRKHSCENETTTETESTSGGCQAEKTQNNNSSNRKVSTDKTIKSIQEGDIEECRREDNRMNNSPAATVSKHKPNDSPKFIKEEIEGSQVQYNQESNSPIVNVYEAKEAPKITEGKIVAEKNSAPLRKFKDLPKMVRIALQKFKYTEKNRKCEADVSDTEENAVNGSIGLSQQSHDSEHQVDKSSKEQVKQREVDVPSDVDSEASTVQMDHTKKNIDVLSDSDSSVVIVKTEQTPDQDQANQKENTTFKKKNGLAEHVQNSPEKLKLNKKEYGDSLTVGRREAVVKSKHGNLWPLFLDSTSSEKIVLRNVSPNKLFNSQKKVLVDIQTMTQPMKRITRMSVEGIKALPQAGAYKTIEMRGKGLCKSMIRMDTRTINNPKNSNAKSKEKSRAKKTIQMTKQKSSKAKVSTTYCRFCNRPFNSRPGEHKHMFTCKKNPAKKTAKCFKCKKEFSQNYALRRHFETKEHLNNIKMFTGKKICEFQGV